MSKKKILVYSLIFITFIIAIYSIPVIKETINSYFTPIDTEYIKKREWLSESGSIIRFDDNSNTLKKDTVYSENEPYGIIKRLNKHLNEIIVFKFEEKQNTLYTSTEEFTK
jgi:hypothetical protein